MDKKFRFLGSLFFVLVLVASCAPEPEFEVSFQGKAVAAGVIPVAGQIPVATFVPHDQVISFSVEKTSNLERDLNIAPTITRKADGKYSLTYGGRGWGSLGYAQTASEMIKIAEEQTQKTSSVLNQQLGTIINPNICQGSTITLSDNLVRELINQANQKGYKVMLDINTGTENPELVCKQMIDRFLPLGSNVYFDLDIEHIHGGGFNSQIDSTTLNRIIEYYFDKREQLGYQEPGMFAFYLFTKTAVINPTALRLHYENGTVVPIADGYGFLSEKQAFANWLDQIYGQKGIMEFVLKWGQKYDKDGRWQEFFQNNPGAIIFAHQ